MENVKKIRKIYFSQKHEPDTGLMNILNTNNPEFNFLKNPVVQNIYMYQIEYLRDFSRQWFDTPAISVLDWGCGKGHVSYWLTEKGMDVTSCDATVTGVTSAFGIDSPIHKKMNRPIVELKHDFLLPFADESFQVVLSFGVLEHVPNDLESLKEIRRVLKPNGLFFCFYLPYKFSYTQNIQHLRGNWYHERLYGKSHVKKLLKSADLKLLDMWHRALLPKISFVPPRYHAVEKMDNWLCNYTPLKYFATNIEFTAFRE